ncbi:MAG: ROK family protein [Actinobacteria bacterium]|nr:MAG: ROK family protein [Actinomycetota bacterium]
MVSELDSPTGSGESPRGQPSGTAGPGGRPSGTARPGGGLSKAAGPGGQPSGTARPGGGLSKAAGSVTPGGSPRPTTLAVDIGGTGVKASVLDPTGAMMVDRLRVKTPHPCPPGALVESLCGLSESLPPFDRVSVGFPGMVRQGRVVTAPNLSTRGGAGTPVLDELVQAWHGFDLSAVIEERTGKPTRVVNDADLQGLGVVEGEGLELVITLGTGMGSSFFLDGELAPHLELAHHPFRKGETYEEQVGEAARVRIGNKRWSRRVAVAAETLDALMLFDRLYVGGGNAKHLKVDLGEKAVLVGNTGGILGGLRLWDAAGDARRLRATAPGRPSG